MREKKQIQYDNEVKLNAEFIMDDFSDFTDGVRVLFLIHRNKEGGNTNNTKVEKLITKNKEEFKTCLLKLLEQKSKSELPYRIYSSVNPRDMGKAIRKFKYEQLEADYYDIEHKHNFYYDIRNRWIGCLMQPTQKAGSNFLFDVDTKDNSRMLSILKDVEFVKMYTTKNGWHIVTKPFNHTKIELPADVSLNVDGLLLLAY